MMSRNTLSKPQPDSASYSVAPIQPSPQLPTPPPTTTTKMKCLYRQITEEQQEYPKIYFRNWLRIGGQITYFGQKKLFSSFTHIATVNSG